MSDIIPVTEPSIGVTVRTIFTRRDVLLNLIEVPLYLTFIMTIGLQSIVMFVCAALAGLTFYRTLIRGTLYARRALIVDALADGDTNVRTQLAARLLPRPKFRDTARHGGGFTLLTVVLLLLGAAVIITMAGTIPQLVGGCALAAVALVGYFGSATQQAVQQLTDADAVRDSADALLLSSDDRAALTARLLGRALTHVKADA